MEKRLFENPPASFREMPFWSWNDDLDEAELKRQVGLFKEGGWGGFFMHARVGLKTPYLGPKWMACIRACVEEARSQGMEAWLYDEDKWPSGFAGGLSVAQNPEYRAQYLVFKVDDRPALLGERIATFQAREQAGQLRDFAICAEPKLKNEADRLVQFYVQTMPLGHRWFNGFAYLNLLSPAAVKAFLDSTHEAYASEVGSDFGGVVPGIFTDEPCTFTRMTEGPGSGVCVPWETRLPEVFHRLRGYDLLPQLPGLFVNTGDFHRVRYDFWRTVTELFLEAYTRQISAWCTEHKLAYTGHYMAEDTMLSQIQWGQAAAMPHYADMHVPGIDKLGRQINDSGCGAILTVKQLDSVVCQTGKPRALCENFGASGQAVAHRHRKWITDWAYVLGVNLSNPHLSMYSLRGERKRDFPQFISYQQPWWQDNDLIADYVARLSYVLSRGERVVDVLVVHPMGSAWALFRPDRSYEVEELDRRLDELLTILLQNHRDFHLGDELLMEPDRPCAPQVVKDAAGVRLQVGKMAYRVVIVPSSLTITKHTKEMLARFADAGGQVLAVESVPTMVDCRTEDDVLPGQARRVKAADVPAALDKIMPFDVRIPGQPRIWVHHRRLDDRDVYFLANTDLEHGCTASVLMNKTGSLGEWNPETGTVQPLAAKSNQGCTEVTLDFPAAGSRLLVLRGSRFVGTVPDCGALGAGDCPHPANRDCVPNPIAREVELSNDWQLSLEGPNALTLDKASFRLEDREWSEPMDILDAQTAVKAAGSGVRFALRFFLDVSALPKTPLFLVMESPETYSISINDKPVSNKDCGWWTDISFRKIDVTGCLRLGKNEIVLSSEVKAGTEIESIYLVGDFGVEAKRLKEEARNTGVVFDRYASEFRVIELPRKAHGAGHNPIASAQLGLCPKPALALDLTSQGLPFFAGRAKLGQVVKLAEVGERAVLQIKGLEAAVARVSVNGQLAGRVAWQPTQVDVSGLLKPGENKVEIELVSTLRNLLGPHHLSGGDKEFIGPSSFRDKRRWTDDYVLTPFGFDSVVVRA